MKIFLVIATCLMTLLSMGIFLEIKAQKDQLIADDIIEIASIHLDESRTILIHLPRTYHEEQHRSYPVIYALDGTSHDQDIARAIGTLNDADVLDEYIVVGIPNTDRNQNLTPPFIHSSEDTSTYGAGDEFLQFIAQELISKIESTYRTNGIKTISGHSRAGLFTFYSYLEKPTLFDAYFCFSPALWRSDGIIIERSKQLEFNGVEPFIYMSMGQNENAKMMKSYQELEEYYKGLQGERSIQFDYTRGANHGTNPIYSIPRALMELSRHAKD